MSDLLSMDGLVMKISEMSFRDRFDDIVDLTVALYSELEERDDAGCDTYEYAKSCEVIMRRLVKLRTDVLRELEKK
jgi:hypothetical protein